MSYGFDGLFKMAIDEAKKQFGNDFNTDETGNWYKLTAPIILSLAYLENKAIAIKKSMNIYTATGEQLDDLLSNDLVFRIKGNKSKGTCIIKGDKGLVIPKNSVLVKGTNNLLYTNISEVVLTNGTATSQFYCTTIGKNGNIPVNNIISTVKAPLGVTDVKNNTEFIDGADLESDYDYLQRYLLTVRTRDWSLPAIISAIKQLNGVKSCDGIRNNTITDGIIPAKSIRIVVDGGDEQEIAETLYKRIHTANTVGSVSKQVKMTEGQYETIRFDRPKVATIDFQYSIISPDKDKIIELIKEYLNEVGIGEIISAEEFRKAKLEPTIQLKIKVLDLGFKKTDDLEYKPYIQLGFDEKGKSGNGVSQ